MQISFLNSYSARRLLLQPLLRASDDLLLQPRPFLRQGIIPGEQCWGVGEADGNFLVRLPLEDGAAEPLPPVEALPGAAGTALSPGFVLVELAPAGEREE